MVKVTKLAHNLAIVTARNWSIHWQAHSLTEMEMQTLRETMVELEAKAQVVTIFHTCQETLTQIKSEKLIDRLAKIVSKWRIRQMVTHCQK